jgi:hypothetical protein
MKTKQLALATTLILLTGLASSAQITPENPVNLNMTTGGENTTSYDIQFENNDENVNVYAENTGQFQVFFSRSYFSSSGSTQVQVEAPDTANTAKNITIVFEGERQNENGTQTFTQERTITAKTRDPYNELFSGWVNKTQVFNIDGTEYNISQIQSSLFLNNNDIQIEQGSNTMLGNVRLSLIDTIPGEYAEVKAETKVDDTSFSVENANTDQQDESCQLFLSTQGGTTIQRGSVFYFQTVKDGTQESVGATYVRLENSKTGDLIGDDTTNQYGYGQISIPETLGANNSDQRISVVAKVQKEDSPCKPSRKTLQPDTPYGEYVQSNEEFQLQAEVTSELADKNTTPINLYGNLTGTVTTKNGDRVKNGVIVVENPSGQRTDFAFEDGSFNYKPQSELGNYRFKVSKTNYADTEWKTFNYQDQCPGIEGTIEAEGCLAQEIDLQYFTADENGETQQVSANKLEPGTTYVLRVYNEEGEINENFNREMNVENSEGESASIEFSSGVARYQWPEEDQGSYSISYDDSGRYEAFDDNVQVQNESMFSDLGIGMNQIAIAVIVILVIAGSLWYFSGSGSSSGSSGRRDVKVDNSDIGGIGSSSSGNSPNLQNQDIGAGEEQ